MTTVTRPALPAAYAWLDREPGPRHLLAALALYGVRETPGPGNTAEIMGWASEVGVRNIYTADMIPWCGLWMAIVMHRADWPDHIPTTPLWARAWATIGQAADRPSLSDILVFSRPGGGGHVGVYVGEDADAYHVLGGNQSDAVTITRIARSRLIAARRPRWRIAQPGNIRPIRLSAAGKLSQNEA